MTEKRITKKLIDIDIEIPDEVWEILKINGYTHSHGLGYDRNRIVPTIKIFINNTINNYQNILISMDINDEEEREDINKFNHNIDILREFLEVL